MEGRPLTPRADFSSQRATTILVELDVAATPERVFESLVDPERIECWFGYAGEVEPHVGGRMVLGVDGRISEFEPGKLLGYGDDEGSVVRWELTDSGGQTHLTLVELGDAWSTREGSLQSQLHLLAQRKILWGEGGLTMSGQRQARCRPECQRGPEARRTTLVLRHRTLAR